MLDVSNGTYRIVRTGGNVYLILTDQGIATYAVGMVDETSFTCDFLGSDPDMPAAERRAEHHSAHTVPSTPV
jgi:hypothetical protein